MKIGDVIFQNLPKIWIVNLINQVQNGGPHHCGICTGFFLGIPLITEAFIFGVWTIPLPLFILRWPFGIKIKSWKDQSISNGISINSQTYLGKPYDLYYYDSDTAIYCSELIAKSYYLSTGKLISSTKTVDGVELSDPPCKDIYFKYLGKYPDPQSKIWLVSDLLNASELN